jgi:cobaltochelatase CobS
MTGLYHGTQQINQGQLDRWHILATLNYLESGQEEKIILGKTSFSSKEEKAMLKQMIQVANLTRKGFANGDISTVMSPRTVLSWAQNYAIFNHLEHSFALSFLNKCDDGEKPIVEEYFQRCCGNSQDRP